MRCCLGSSSGLKSCCCGRRTCNCATSGQAALTPNAELSAKTHPNHLHKHVVVILEVIVGVLISGLVTDNVVVRFAEYIPDETLINVLGYVIAILVSGVLAFAVGTLVKKLLRVGMLGWTDRLAGMALGSATGLAITVAVIVGMAGLAYSDQVSSDIPSHSYVEKVLDISDAREMMANALTKSAVAPTVIGLLDSSPIGNLAFVPSGFKVAADTLSAKSN